MFDFSAFRATVPPGQVLDNPALHFADDSQVSRTTGEEITRRGGIGPRDPITKKWALSFTYNVRTQQLNGTGSLHKYAHGRNSTDFTRHDVAATVDRLADELQLPPDRLNLRALEFGVNVIPPCPTPVLIKRLQAWQPTGTLRTFRPMNRLPAGVGKDTHTNPNTKFWIKAYNKAWGKMPHERLPTPLLRLEYHTQVTDLCKRLGSSQTAGLTLADLKEPEIWNGCARLLTDALDGIIWHEHVDTDRMPAKDARLYSEAGRPEYWSGLTSSTRSRHRDRYRQLGRQYRTDSYTSQLIAAAAAKVYQLGLDRPAPPAAVFPVISFAAAIAPFLTRVNGLSEAERHRLDNGRCVVCNSPLPPDRHPATQTCPRSVRQCRNVKSNRYHDRLKPLRHDYQLARAGQGRLFTLDTGLHMPGM
jgi:hypothetical protein